MWRREQRSLKYPPDTFMRTVEEAQKKVGNPLLFWGGLAALLLLLLLLLLCCCCGSDEEHFPRRSLEDIRVDEPRDRNFSVLDENISENDNPVILAQSKSGSRALEIASNLRQCQSNEGTNTVLLKAMMTPGARVGSIEVNPQKRLNIPRGHGRGRSRFSPGSRSSSRGSGSRGSSRGSLTPSGSPRRNGKRFSRQVSQKYASRGLSRQLSIKSAQDRSNSNLMGGAIAPHNVVNLSGSGCPGYLRRD